MFPSWNVGVNTTYWKAVVCVVCECASVCWRDRVREQDTKKEEERVREGMCVCV